MNAAFLIMSTAALAGADPTMPPPPPAAPVVVSTGAGCSNCGTPVSTGCCGSTKAGLLDRIKARWGGGFGRKKSSCGCAPTPCCVSTPAITGTPIYTPGQVYAPPPSYTTYTPAPCCAPAAPAPCNTCAPTCCDMPNLFNKMKSWWGTKKNRNGPCCDPCGAAYVVPQPAPPITGGMGTTVPPKEMPKPKDKGMGGNTSSIPQPLPSVNGAGLTGSNSRY